MTSTLPTKKDREDDLAKRSDTNEASQTGNPVRSDKKIRIHQYNRSDLLI